MAFVVQCPFCNLRVKAPDRAIGAIGHCPKCSNAFTLASADDEHLPESATADSDSDIQPVPSTTVSAAIEVAIASTAAKSSVLVDSAADSHLPMGAQPTFETSRAAGATALLLAGFALIAGFVVLLHGVVLPLSAMSLMAGLTGIVLASRSERARLFLPIAASGAAAIMLLIAWLFPALLGPAYEHSRRRPEPLLRELHAIRLPGAPALDGPPEWVDATRYALARDGIRVQVVHMSPISPAAIKAKAPPELEGRLLLRVRVSLDMPNAKPLKQKDEPIPTLTDRSGQLYSFLHSEFFDRGGGDGQRGIYAEPTIEETFVFAVPAEVPSHLRLRLPAARWSGTDEFQFTIVMPVGSTRTR